MSGGDGQVATTQLENHGDAANREIVLGIVGAGLMGSGIAQIAALAGVTVRLFDANPDAAQAARQELAKTFAMLAGQGKLSGDAAEAALTRIAPAATLGELADCSVVIEAIIEHLEAKQKLFVALEAVVRDDCLLATNTSSLSVTSIAAACRLPTRVGGFHFFSPVPLMKIVEVIDGELSAPWVGELLAALARRMGHTPVRAKDTPGFIVNHAGRGYLTESLRVLGEGIAEPHEIDAIMKGAGFRLGPCELLDLTGLDISHPVMESIYGQYYQEPRYRPSPITRQRLAAGLLGRKSGRGFYAYADGRAELPAPAPVPPDDGRALWVSAHRPAARAVLLERLAAAGRPIDTGGVPGADSVCVVLPLGADTTSTALDEGLDPSRTVAVDPLFSGDTIALASTPLTTVAARDSAWAALAADGTRVVPIHDSAGLVAQRVVAMIINTACDIAQQRIATPAAIDLAVTLGLGYPHGPLAWGDRLGAATVLAVLDAMHDFYRDPRYRPSPWLVRRARLGVSLLTPEN